MPSKLSFHFSHASLPLLLTFSFQALSKIFPPTRRLMTDTIDMGQMKTNIAPLCQCGEGSMLLRKAGEFSTRPGKYYYICPASLTHPNKFYWYDEYHGNVFTPTKQTWSASEHESSTVTSQSFVKRNVKTGMASSSSSPSMQNIDVCDKGIAYATKNFSEADNDKMEKSNMPRIESLKRSSISIEAICCCFGFTCFFLSLLLVLVVFIAMRM